MFFVYFFTDYGNEDLFTLMNLLDLNDIQTICNKFKFKRAATKEERIQILLKYCSTQSTLMSTMSSKDLVMREVKQKLGNCFKIKKEFQDHFYNIYLLATFTNPAFSNINDFFTNILGLKICLPSYTIQDYDVFHTRDEFLRLVSLSILNYIQDIIAGVRTNENFNFLGNEILSFHPNLKIG